MPKGFAVFSLGMGIFFIVMSIYVVVRPPEFIGDSALYKFGLAAAVFAYGAFRVTRAVKSLKDV